MRLTTQFGRTIPDVHRQGRLIVEIKDVGYLYRTGQILSQGAAAEAEGSAYFLLTSEGTAIAGTVAQTGATVGVVDVAAGTIVDVAGASLLETILEILATAALL